MESTFPRYTGRSSCSPLITRDSALAADIAAVTVLPLDPRLGEDGFRGPQYLLETAEIRRFLPMHQWGDFGFTEKFLARYPEFRSRTLPVAAEGQTFSL